VDKTVLFIDVVGSVKMYQELGNEVAERTISQGIARISQIITEQSGRVIKTIGDCVMAELPAPDQAAAAAFAVNRTVRGGGGGGAQLRFRMGFYHGPVVERDGDMFGDVVNIAARLCSTAKADHILTTEPCGQLLGGEHAEAVRVYDRITLKGVSHPMTIVSLLWDRRAVTQLFSRTMVGQRGVDLAAALQPYLRLQYRGEEIMLAAENLPFTLGRDKGCNLIVPTQFASRVHLRLENQRGKFVLVDESSNGTFVVPAGTSPDAPMFVLHEMCTLVGEGQFSLGRKVEGDEDVIAYRVMLNPALVKGAQ
jgi:class 3 adenylate cyclase